MTSRTDRAGHTKAFDYPVWTTGGKSKYWYETDSNRRPVGPASTTLTPRPRGLPYLDGYIKCKHEFFLIT